MNTVQELFFPEPVTVYFASDMMGTIHRYDVKELSIVTGQKYAQYNDAIKVSFLEKGKRNKRGKTLFGRDNFCIVVSRELAVNPDPMYDKVPGQLGGLSRYGAFDSRWESDFRDKLGNTPLLFDAQAVSK